MKTLDLSNIQFGIRQLYATRETYLHVQEALLESLSSLIKGFGVLDTDVTAFNGVVNAGSGSNYNISAGAAYYQGEVFLIDALVGTAGGGQVPVLTIETTYRAGDPVLYSDLSSFNTHAIRKLKWSFGASGTGIKDYSQLVRLSSYITADLTAINAAITTIQGQITTIQGQITTIQGQISTLTTNLNTEITNRTNADNTLQTNINTEVTNRTNADTNLQNQINTINSGLVVAFTNISTAATGWTGSGFTFGYKKTADKLIAFRGVLGQSSLTGTTFVLVALADVPAPILSGLPATLNLDVTVINGSGTVLPAKLQIDSTVGISITLNTSVTGATLNVFMDGILFYGD